MDTGMTPRRILVLMHPDLIPPKTLRGYTTQEINVWKTEYDVTTTLRRLGHEVRPLARHVEHPRAVGRGAETLGDRRNGGSHHALGVAGGARGEEHIRQLRRGGRGKVLVRRQALEAVGGGQTL